MEKNYTEELKHRYPILEHIRSSAIQVQGLGIPAEDMLTLEIGSILYETHHIAINMLVTYTEGFNPIVLSDMYRDSFVRAREILRIADIIGINLGIHQIPKDHIYWYGYRDLVVAWRDMDKSLEPLLMICNSVAKKVHSHNIV